MNRKEFMKFTASIIGGLSLPFGMESLVNAANEHDTSLALDVSYLDKGLTAMARADHWFDAHWGAAVIAGFYLCTENQLDEQTTVAVKNQLDAVIQLRAEQFLPFSEESSDERLIEDIPQALRPAIEGGLRAHGHAVIFSSLSMKALRDVPHAAHPTMIRRLCGLSDQISKISPQSLAGDGAPYVDTQAMIEATFDSLSRFHVVLGRPSVRRPNFTHMVTHTEALLNLEKMGYADLAAMGRLGQKVHINAQVPQIDTEIEQTLTNATLETVMEPDFWIDADHQDQWSRSWNATDNRNGDWIASGHLFKVLYAFHRLINRIEDKEKEKLCSRILLERYSNPEVQGG